MHLIADKRRWLRHGLDPRLCANRQRLFFWADVKQIQVGIGTPPQSVVVLVDTGSSELWVNPDCTTTRTQLEAQQCAQFGKYNPRKSTTPPIGPFGGEVINYGDPTDEATLTSVEITYYSDNLSVGNANITNQTFGVVTQSEDQGQGILGLAPDLRGGFDTEEPYSLVLNTMAKQGVISSRAFSLDLRHADAETGAIIYGGLDRNKFIGTLESRPIVRGEQGEFRLSIELDTLGLTLDGEPQNYGLTDSDKNVLLDSGTTITRLHPGVAVPILNVLGAQDDGEGYFFVPCSLRDMSGSVDFGFGSKTVRVPFKDFILNVGDDQICYVGVVMTSSQQILGDSVLRAGYFVFDWDNEAVHVAQAANWGDRFIVAIGSGSGAVPQATGNCKDEDAIFTDGIFTDGSPVSQFVGITACHDVFFNVEQEPTRTREPGSFPTESYTTVYTITSCPPIDRECRTGLVTTQTVGSLAQPTVTDSNSDENSNRNGNGTGEDGDSAAVARPQAAGLLLVLMSVFAALFNAA